MSSPGNTQSNAVFDSLAAENNNISSAVSKLPTALNTTKTTLSKVDGFSDRLRPTLQSLREPFRRLDTANKAVLPLAREGTPEIRDQIRPFARIAPPYLRDLGAASKDLTTASPDLTVSLNKLNRLFNIGAYNPGGAQGLTGNPTTDRNRQEGYLYWLAWTANNTNSLFSTADASGPIRRVVLFGLNCTTVKAGLATAGAPNLDVLNGVVDTLGTAGVCTK